MDTALYVYIFLQTPELNSRVFLLWEIIGLFFAYFVEILKKVDFRRH